jgi:2-iminobutanoate/2-iminopropanoate deaminase
MPPTPFKRKGFRVEPISTYLDRWRAPIVPVTRAGDIVHVAGLPPFDPATGEVLPASIERQTELVLDQMRLCLEAAGTNMANVLKCNVYCTKVEAFGVVNEIYARYFPTDPPARIFITVAGWPGPFDIEIDCVAAAGEAACLP